jgi:hypothetical protein
MICTLVLHVAQACEAVLAAKFLFGAHDTFVPILHVEATGETNILDGPSFNNDCILQVGGLLILDSCRNVWDHLIPSNVLGGCHLATSSSSLGTAHTPAVTATAHATPALLVLLLILIQLLN